MPKAKNPQVFLDISIGPRDPERITIELFANEVPRTAENFRALCTGERGLATSSQKPLYFKQTNIHRIVKGFVAQGGDFSRGDGCGGESIYGGKFPDENFKIKHDQRGVLSMANSGADSNGSQFFITFKPLPHLDGKHVVFGKVISGIALLDKLEAVGTDNGKPACVVKIVNCGEVSDTHLQIQLQGEKKKKLKKLEDNSDAEGRVKTKKPPTEKHRRKRKHYSSDSYSSDSSDSRSYSSDPGSESESYSSSSLDTSSSSDHRHKRRKGSKKEKYKSAKRKRGYKKSKRKSRGTKKKSKRRYESSSDDSSSSSSESENEGRRTKNSSKKDLGNSKMVNLEKGRTLEDADKDKQAITTGDMSRDDGGRSSQKNEKGADGNQNSEDRYNKFRNDQCASSRHSPIRVDANLTQAGGNSTADVKNADTSRAGTERKLLTNEPVPTNGKDLAMGTDNGQPHRIRKGRGFTEKYSSARRYRTPSPERSPVRSRYNGGRHDRWNHFNRYGRNGPYGARSPVRRYFDYSRGSNPSRYPRRDRSRSRSRSPVRRHDRGGYRRPSPRRNHSRSPTEQGRDVISRPPSGHVSGGPDNRGSSPPANRGRSRSRSKSHDPSRSRSPDAAPVKKGSSKYNRRRSSSSRSSSPAGSKGLVSY